MGHGQYGMIRLIAAERTIYSNDKSAYIEFKFKEQDSSYLVHLIMKKE